MATPTRVTRSSLFYATFTLVLAAGCATRPSPRGNAAVPDGGLRAAGVDLYELENVFETDTGAQLKLSELRGRRLAVAMFDASRAGSEALQSLRDIEDSLPPSVRERIGFVLVTRDPVRDTSAALAAYRAARRLPQDHWILLRGSEAATSALSQRLAQVSSDRGAATHPAEAVASVTVVDETGRVVDQRTGLHADLSRTLAALKGAAPLAPRPEPPAAEALANLPMGL